MSRPRRLPPVHPGEILMEEFLRPAGLSQWRVAPDCGVPPRRINEIVHCERAISADTALRLGRYFGTSAQFWMNLQTAYDLAQAEAQLGARLTRHVKVLPRSA
jgi:addiction module HigA family antidote